MPKQTPLYPAHLEAGAKIVDFAGWDMPIHYGSQLTEHHQVRRDSGMFDVSHMLPIDVTGAGAQAYLAYLLANNVPSKLKEPGRALYSCMLDESGGVIDDLIVYYFSAEEYRIVVNAGTADKDVAWMRQVAARLPGGGNVTIAPRRDLAMIAVQGPQARSRFWGAFPAFKASTEALRPFQGVKLLAAPAGTACSALEQEILNSAQTIVARTGYTGEDGFELMLPANCALDVWQALLTAGVLPIGLGARDTLRLEAGMNLYGQDMDETVNPLESGLAWTVDLSPGRDFIGRAALEAADVTQQLVGLVLVGRGVLRSHMPVFTASGEGQTTSGSYAPTMDASIAFARIPKGIAIGDSVEVDIRGKRLPAKVSKLPFVRNGKTLNHAI